MREPSLIRDSATPSSPPQEMVVGANYFVPCSGVTEAKDTYLEGFDLLCDFVGETLTRIYPLQ